MVMCSNHSSAEYFRLASENTGRLGWLLSPACFKRPRTEVPFALDNDAYSNWKKGKEFDLPAWIRFLDKIRAVGVAPMWCAVPDVVANRDATLTRWKSCSKVAEIYGWPLAFVVQDGMTPRDIPKTAAVIFVGGTTSWKWRTIPMWVSVFPRVHVGRCGTSRWKLERLEQLGVESCDGSGFFRATTNGREARQLKAWLTPQTKQIEFDHVYTI